MDAFEYIYIYIYIYIFICIGKHVRPLLGVEGLQSLRFMSAANADNLFGLAPVVGCIFAVDCVFSTEIKMAAFMLGA